MAETLNRDSAAAEFLTDLEKQEAGLLAWGVVDGSFSDDELDELARRFLDRHGLWGTFSEKDQLIRLVEERGLLFPIRHGTRFRYRTRTAETVRLLLRLRQLFPKHADGSWRTAPQLVADARFLIRSRAYPRRHLLPGELIAALGPSNPLREETFRTLIDGRLLADFQLRATERILHELDRGATSGTVVCAGTGSGKTLAFYLPAIGHIAETLDRNDWVRCLAIYPRNELLKDQFTEAYAQCRRLREVLKRAGRRPIRLGALFGPTPRRADAFESPWPPDAWRRLSGGYVCPLLRCPDCGGVVIWADEDRAKTVERLRCIESECGTTIEPQEIVLTRERLRQSPPDVLFTTTEMLNQRMSDSRFGRLFGVGQPAERKPRLLLLDEVHTYAGTSGAQAAYLLRRWQHAARCSPHIVGLSATLRNAPQFFATLTGLPPSAVEEVAARPTELVPHGTEYLLAMRGNPAAGTSLLSVTIQTSMLVARALDSRLAAQSQGLFGSKLFLFTDDLDVTNRLFFNLRDAEGQDSWGNPKQDPIGSLANLRASTRPQASNRFRDGQSWELCERLGHLLQPDIFSRIGRTSSQDAGVDADADQIVATAALEVGFNDPAVGAVIQHKAPLDAAAFLQRKGRAGRNPQMRPWTVVVLSDYGRDRLAYQSYDLLFNPELLARELPIGNRHVRRMQAVFAMIDWLGFQLEGFPPGSVWQDISVPTRERTVHERDNVRRRQKRLEVLAEEVLSRLERREELAAYVQAALRLSDGEVEGLLWDSPRPLLTAVVPTLLRRLRTQWHGDYFEHNAPLPDFVPRALFQDLSLPEITVVTPPQQRGESERRDAMRAGQALNEFAPGRVSRRFGVQHRYAQHWVEPLDLGADLDQRMPLSRFVAQDAAESLGRFEMFDDVGQVVAVLCVRPWELRATVPPRHVIDSSNAFLEWRTQIVPSIAGIPGTVPPVTPWSGLIAELQFCTHASHCPIEVRRFALGCEASIGFEDGRRFEPRIRFTDDAGQSAAIGFAHDADAVLLSLQLQPELHRAIAPRETLVRSLRVALFRHRVRIAAELDGLANVFARDWLAEAFLCAVLGRVVAGGDLRPIVENSPPSQLLGVISAALDVLFQAMTVEQPDNEMESDAAEAASPTMQRQKTHGRLLKVLEEPTVLAVLCRTAAVLWQPPDATWDDWLRSRVKATVGAAAVDAIQRMCPDVNANEVLVDPEPGPRITSSIGSSSEIWLTETAVGGGGVLEKFQLRFGEDPRRFFDLLSHALEPTDFETADAELTRFLNCLADPAEQPLIKAVAEVRTGHTRSNAEFSKAFDSLLAHLRQREFALTHTFVAALASRVLRAGTSDQSDRLLYDLLVRWRDLESRLGLEIDGRMFAWLTSDDDSVGHLLATVAGATLNSRGERFAAIAGLLWPRGSEVWGQRMRVRNPYLDVGVPDRELALALLPAGPEPIRLTDSTTSERIRTALLTDGTAVIAADPAAARNAVLQFTAEPIDTGLVLTYPRIRSASRANGSVVITLELAEVS